MRATTPAPDAEAQYLWKIATELAALRTAHQPAAHLGGSGDANGKKAPPRLGRPGRLPALTARELSTPGPKPPPRHRGAEDRKAPGRARSVPAPLPGRASPSSRPPPGLSNVSPRERGGREREGSSARPDAHGLGPSWPSPTGLRLASRTWGLSSSVSSMGSLSMPGMAAAGVDSAPLQLPHPTARPAGRTPPLLPSHNTGAPAPLRAGCPAPPPLPAWSFYWFSHPARPACYWRAGPSVCVAAGVGLLALRGTSCFCVGARLRSRPSPWRLPGGGYVCRARCSRPPSLRAAVGQRSASLAVSRFPRPPVSKTRGLSALRSGPASPAAPGRPPFGEVSGEPRQKGTFPRRGACPAVPRADDGGQAKLLGKNKQSGVLFWVFGGFFFCCLPFHLHAPCYNSVCPPSPVCAGCCCLLRTDKTIILGAEPQCCSVPVTREASFALFWCDLECLF